VEVRMFFKQFKVDGLGCLSYLIGCPSEGTAVVVDPKRDYEDYIIAAEENGLKITSVIDTHVHADHVSGAIDLAKRTGATIYTGNDPDMEFQHIILKQGDKLQFGNALLEVIETPGHTPYSISLLITDLARSNNPTMILTGDLLFVGSIGRPDLAGRELLDEQIKNLYNSLYNKILKLPDYIEIYPAHGEGSLCGAGLSSKPMSTIGFEKASNKILNLSFEEFKKEVFKKFPHRPKNFSYIIMSNKKGAAFVDDLPKIKHFYVSELKKFIANGGIIVDLRDATSFGAAHIKGSINIGFSLNSTTWLGTVVEPEKDILLLGNNRNEIEQSVTNFRRVGFDNIKGYLIGLSSWVLSGEDTGFLPQISIHTLKHVMEKYNNHNIIDVRSEDEWNSGHIKGAVHIPLEKFFEKELELEFKEHISIICGSGYRSNIAGSILKSKGYKNVYSVIGGMIAWNKRFETV
jgi:glyoxylase-like metal-dependent hydrolase (beta-lactamase superfamily II)/rhodanese-related sulfurtransferase